MTQGSSFLMQTVLKISLAHFFGSLVLIAHDKIVGKIYALHSVLVKLYGIYGAGKLHMASFSPHTEFTDLIYTVLCQSGF